MRPRAVTVDRLREALGALATIMDEEGWTDRLWPLFERIETELAAIESRAERVAKARAGLRRGATAQTEARS